VIGETNPGQVNGGAGFPLVVFQILTGQSVNDDFAQGFPGLELIILGQVADAGASAGQSLAGIGLQGSGQKLEEGGERRLIHTVRGKGYCLAERLPPHDLSSP
jgi:hypothetical protein